mgnify:FL=1
MENDNQPNGAPAIPFMFGDVMTPIVYGCDLGPQAKPQQQGQDYGIIRTHDGEEMTFTITGGKEG